MSRSSVTLNRSLSFGLCARRPWACLAGSPTGGRASPSSRIPLSRPRRCPSTPGRLRQLLDARELDYGMFGHADVGCLHVRPMIDMRDPEQAAAIRPISDAVAALVRQHGGLLWGEHGRGVRGEYSPMFFGAVLYPELVRIKQAFDAGNLFNPGKLVAPGPEATVDRIDAVPFRGAADRHILADRQTDIDRAVACNGNGACRSWDARDTMCPSYKATRDRAQSPQGRAALLRLWGRGDANDAAEVEQALITSLSTCLSCKACTTLCPVNVDIPTMKSRFLETHYSEGRRPLRHHALAALEAGLALGRTAPRLVNWVMATGPAKALAKRVFGLVDLPAFSRSDSSNLPLLIRPAILRALDADRLARTVVVIEDSFTASFDRTVLAAAGRALQTLGYDVYRLPPRANGKMLYVLGMRSRFASIARARAGECAELATSGATLIGLDAATALMHEQEYREFASTTPVVCLETFLAREIIAGRIAPREASAEPAVLLGHCTEQALRPAALDEWCRVFVHLGIAARPMKTGCCGMAGLFGHEAEHVDLSRRLFDLSWRAAVETSGDVVATGYSCRSQAKRLAGARLRHPIELLAAHIAAAAPTRTHHPT